MKKTIIIPFLAILFLTSCEDNNTTGNGPIVVQELTIANFSGIESYGSNTINISYGETQKVTVTGHANIIDNLEKGVQNDIWKIKLKDGNYKNAELKFDIVIPRLSSVKLNGSGATYIEDFTSNKIVNLRISGSSNMVLNGNTGCEDLNIDIEGSGKITVLGVFKDLQNLNIDTNGSGVYDGFSSIAQNSNINISGSGYCNISVEKSLKVKISGSGIVNYKGQPAITADISGSGQVHNAN